MHYRQAKNCAPLAKDQGLVIAGYSKKEIAQKLGVSTQAIKHDVANLFDKLGGSNRLELVLFALHHRLIG
jgi:DNA-binding NarL/FixJ family response regulator